MKIHIKYIYKIHLLYENTYNGRQNTKHKSQG